MASTVDAKEIERRALLIKQRARFNSAIRMAFIPAITLYSLFMTRPREGHFHRYIAERRFYDPTFNAQFPQLDSAPEGSIGTTKSKKTDEKSTPQGERELRRSAMFRRETVPGDEQVDQIAKVELDELRNERRYADQRLTMPLILAQLRQLSSPATSININEALSTSVASLSFEESIFWSTGELHVAGRSSPRKFVGVFGMMWREL